MTTSGFIPTSELLSAVKAAVETLPLAAGGSLFQAVKLYDSSDIDRAFADTLVARQQRICFIMPGRVYWENVSDDTKLISKKKIQFACLICDTDRRTGQEAVFGGPHAQGVLQLGDAVVKALSGSHLGYPRLLGVCVEPMDGDEITVTKEGDSDSGRKGWFLTLETYAGKVVAARLS